MPTLPHIPSRKYPAVLTALTAFLPGAALCALLAGLAVALGGNQHMQRLGLSALSLAIVLGMLMGNTVYGRYAAALSSGVDLSKQKLLRLGIVLYGLRVTLQDVAAIGLQGAALAALMLGLTFALACWLGTRLLDLDRRTSMLIGAGSSICGAAAVLATEPVVKGRPEQVTVAVATVVVFGTVAIFLYPALYALSQGLGLLPSDSHHFGVYIGATVHEVAQVVAAGASVGADAENTAVIVKMVRVMLLAPFLIALSAWLVRHPEPDTGDHASTDGVRKGAAIPWFAVGFLLVVVLNSTPLLPAAATRAGIAADHFILAMAMAALGLTTHVGAIRKAGLKPLLLALLLFVWLVAGGAGLSQLLLR